MLRGVNVVIGVTGSIAAVKTVEIVHELQREGANVKAVMTESAESIIHPWSLEFATTNPVITELTGNVEHIELFGADGWADVFLIAPATANTLGKIAHAIDDTPVTTCATTAFGADIPVLIAPAMHEPMYDHPGVLNSIAIIESWGGRFIDPRIEEDKAKIATKETLALEVARTTDPSPLADRHIVITSGATTEPIDPVRILTNRASGKTGRAVARACYASGANVTLIHNGPDVPYATVISIERAEDMIDRTLESLESADALISAAAISDYTVEYSEEKLRSKQDLTIDLHPTRKLIDTAREKFPDQPIVGFKTETADDDDELINEARRILDRVTLAFVVANNANVMGQDSTRAIFVEPDGTTEFTGSKQELGLRIADKLAAFLE